MIFFCNLCFADFRNVENFQSFIYDFSVSGGTSNTNIDFTTAVSGGKSLPSNAIITDVGIKVVTAFTSSSQKASITIGNTTSSDGYLLAHDISEFTDNALFVGDGNLVYSTSASRPIMFLSDDTNDRNIVLKVTKGNPITAGKMVVFLKYFTPLVD